MFYVVAYDLPNNKRRSKIFKLLKGYGVHTQYSLFECSLDEKEYDELLQRLEKIIDKKEDDIKIYQICGSCIEKVVCIGRAVLNTEKDVIII